MSDQQPTRGPTRRAAFGTVAGAGLLLARPAAAQTPEPPRRAAIDALFSVYDSQDSPGLAVGVFRSGTPIHIGCHGMADLEQGRPVTPTTVFHLASVSKQFTGLAVALLARDGRVDLAADIRRYLPDTPTFQQPVTVAHLVHHTSGLRDQWQLFELAGRDLRGVVTQAQILELVRRQRALNFAPGSNYAYCNTGYTLLAEIVQAVSGKTLRAFCAERIFAPLGMGRTFVNDDLEAVVPERANSYDGGAGRWRRALLNYDTFGPTSLCTTITDMACWAGELCEPTVGDRALVDRLSEGVTLEDGTPLNYGFGLQRGRFQGRDGVFHTGSDAAFRSAFAHFPQEKVSIVVLSNTKLDTLKVIEAVVDVFLNGRTDPVLDPPPLPAPAELLAASLGWFETPDSPLVNIVSDGAGLAWRTAGAARPLRFTADDGFHLGDPRTTRYRFVRSAGGVEGIDEISQVAQGKARRFARTTAPRTDRKAMAALAGRYRLSELATDYDISLRGDTLVARTFLGGEPLVFVPGGEDRFDSRSGGLTLAVLRDGRGRAIGAELSSSRCRALRLDRVAA